MENLNKQPDENRKAFEAYKKEKEKEGQEIDSRAIAAGQREMELGRKGGYPVYGDEPTRAEKFKHDPEGHLYRTDLSKEELAEEIKILTELREKVISILEPAFGKLKINLKISKETTLQELKDSLAPEDADTPILIFNLRRYGFEYETLLFDLPQMIEDKIKYDVRTLDHIK